MHNETMNVNVGDWIRFQQGGVLVIGVVQYVNVDNLGQPQAVSDAGTVIVKRILENRRA